MHSATEPVSQEQFLTILATYCQDAKQVTNEEWQAVEKYIKTSAASNNFEALNVRDQKTGHTILTIAVQSKYLPLVQLLADVCNKAYEVNAGNNLDNSRLLINIPGAHGLQPLSQACVHYIDTKTSETIFCRLTEIKGIDINALTTDPVFGQHTALTWAAKIQMDDQVRHTQLITYLANKGAMLSPENKTSKLEFDKAFNFFASNMGGAMLTGERANLVSYILDNSPTHPELLNVTLPTQDNHSLLTAAIHHNDMGIFDLIIKTPGIVNLPGKSGYTPLQYVCGEYGSALLVKKILDTPEVDVYARGGPDNKTAFYYAAIHGNLDALSQLIEHNPNYFILDEITKSLTHNNELDDELVWRETDVQELKINPNEKWEKDGNKPWDESIQKELIQDIISARKKIMELISSKRVNAERDKDGKFTEAGSIAVEKITNLVIALHMLEGLDLLAAQKKARQELEINGLDGKLFVPPRPSRFLHITNAPVIGNFGDTGGLPSVSPMASSLKNPPTPASYVSYGTPTPGSDSQGTPMPTPKVLDPKSKLLTPRPKQNANNLAPPQAPDTLTPATSAPLSPSIPQPSLSPSSTSSSLLGIFHNLNTSTSPRSPDPSISPTSTATYSETKISASSTRKDSETKPDVTESDKVPSDQNKNMKNTF